MMQHFSNAITLKMLWILLLFHLSPLLKYFLQDLSLFITIHNIYLTNVSFIIIQFTHFFLLLYYLVLGCWLWFFLWSCVDVRVGLWRRLSAKELMLLNYGVGEDSWESLVLQGDPTSPFWRRSALELLWREWCWSWNSSTLATSCEELTHWKRLWCWEGLGAGGEGDDRGWDGWMASLTRWTWVWVNSRSWWWTGRPGMLQFMGSQRDWHDWVTELNWTELKVLVRNGKSHND